MKFYTVTLWHIRYCNYGYSVIDGRESRKIYRLSDDEREWIEIGEIPEKTFFFQSCIAKWKNFYNWGMQVVNFMINNV